jgi:hypothetical protein
MRHSGANTRKPQFPKGLRGVGNVGIVCAAPVEAQNGAIV